MTVGQVSRGACNEGREEGRKAIERMLAHQFERRLARPLRAAERKRLKERLRVEGSDKVGDAILELSTAELSAWLAPSNGHRS